MVSFRCGLFATIIATFVAGCAKDPVYPGDESDAGGGTGGAGAGGGSGADGAAGDGGASTATCDPAGSTMGRIDKAAPFVSMGKPVTASAGVTNAPKAVDGAYHNGTAAAFPATATADAPAWLAINVGAGPTHLLLTWTDVGYTPYNVVTGGAPGSYKIEVSGDSTNGQDGAWQMVASATGNTVRARGHRFPFAGKSWVRFAVTGPAAGGGAVQLDEIALHDLTASGEAAPPDTWFFMGDSITQGAFMRNLNVRFDTDVRKGRPAYYPAMLNGGIGGELSSDGVRHIGDWLTFNADFTHIPILYGTNDSWGDKTAATSGFEQNMTMIVDAVLAAGKVPILARIPYATVAHATLADFNAIIDRITTARGLPCGPDFYGWFKDHPTELSDDGVHPNGLGYASMNRLWAEAALRLYPAN